MIVWAIPPAVLALGDVLRSGYDEMECMIEIHVHAKEFQVDIFGVGRIACQHC